MRGWRGEIGDVQNCVKVCKFFLLSSYEFSSCSHIDPENTNTVR